MIDEVLLVYPSRMYTDDRGFFCVLNEPPCDGDSRRVIAHSTHAGTLRGMHIRSGAGEGKLVRCSAGSIYDVIVDLRPGSPTYRRWVGLQLDGVSQQAVYIPAGYAHGYETLRDDTDVTYRIDAGYSREADLVFRWDDPELAIQWPVPPAVMSDRDRDAPLLAEMEEILCLGLVFSPRLLTRPGRCST